jgi:DNA polymerase III subunit delta
MPRTCVVPALRPSGGQLTAWLRQRARADGVALDEDAAALLVDLCGDDLTQLRSEIEKAALVGGPDNRRVGVAEVRAVVGEHRLRHIFELTRALALGDAGAALPLCESLQNGGEEPLAVLAMLAREIRAAWQVTEGLRVGRREEEIARELRRPPAAAAALIQRARSLPPDAVTRLLGRAWETERRLKLGGAPRAELSLLIADLCAG